MQKHGEFDLMKIKFLGANNTVTGSKHLLKINDKHALVDCGLFQGQKRLRLRNWEQLAYPADKIDAVLLTHASIGLRLGATTMLT